MLDYKKIIILWIGLFQKRITKCIGIHELMIVLLDIPKWNISFQQQKIC